MKVWIVLGAATALAIGAVAAIWMHLREPSLRIDRVLAAYATGAHGASLTIAYPPSGAVFPPEIAPATFRWDGSGADGWVVRVELAGDKPAAIGAACEKPQWTPDPDQWEAIKAGSRDRPAQVTVLAVDRRAQDRILAAGSVSIATSSDEVGAPLFYREVNLPFIDAVRDPSRIRWRFGPVSSLETPPVILENLPVCGNCHSFSADGSVLGMDVDYANDKGSYAIAPVGREIVLDDKRIISWSEYRPDDGVPTFGLLSQVSPDGRYVVSTVKDRSVFVPRPELAFSQLFFPIKGILVVHDRKTGRFQKLPGADDPQYVQSNPSWSPDGKWIVFARSKAYQLEGVSDEDVLLSPQECEQFLSGREGFQFDLYRLPFNGGAGGTPEPLEGASGNGMSNYFPKYSPDGKWIVFCRAKDFMLLQADSQLYIIPAAGGAARRLEGNTGRMNSWHSWSPNSRWLVFSSKANGPYTQLFLTHIDPDGHSSPAVVLDRMSSADRAANIPEFVDLPANAIARIRQHFVSDHSFVRAAIQSLRSGDFASAEEACRKALELNPENAEALCNLGIVRMRDGRDNEAEELFLRALRIDPGVKEAHFNLAAMAEKRGQFDEAVGYYQRGLNRDPASFGAQLALGTVLLTKLGRAEEAIGPLNEAVRLVPGDPQGHFYLGLALQQEGRTAEAARHFRAALKWAPDDPLALTALAYIAASATDPALRSPEEAVSLARRACRLTEYGSGEPLEVLAIALAAAGQPEDAIRAAQQALALVRAAGDTARARVIEARIEQYARQRQQGPRQSLPDRRTPSPPSP